MRGHFRHPDIVTTLGYTQIVKASELKRRLKLRSRHLETPRPQKGNAALGDYLARFEPDPHTGGFVVTFPDFGYGVTRGETAADALAMAQDLLILTLADFIRAGQPVPAPKRYRGARYRPVPLPALAAAKLALYTAFLASGLRKAAFVRLFFRDVGCSSCQAPSSAPSAVSRRSGSSVGVDHSRGAEYCIEPGRPVRRPQTRIRQTVAQPAQAQSGVTVGA
jgi:predicted RNase H-like HicB family nuclease